MGTKKNIQIYFIIFEKFQQISVEVFMCARNETQRKLNLLLCAKYALEWSVITLTKFYAPFSVKPTAKRTFRSVVILFIFYNEFTIIDL
jgi:hypothetical protein